MQYTPTTDPNAAPQYGQSGPNVVAAQAAYNQKNMEGIKNGTVTALETDGKYGPLTQAALLGNRQMVNDSSKAMSGYNNASLALDQQLAQTGAVTTATRPAGDTKEIVAATYSDPYTQALQGLSDRSNTATKSLIATIQANHQNEVNEVERNYDRYSRGMQLLGINEGDAQFTPELLKGQLLEIKNQKMSKISKLDQDMTTAIMEAENARADNDLKTLKERMDYVRQLKKDKADAIKDLADSDKNMMQKAEFFGDKVYDAISGLSGAQKTKALQEMSKELGIPIAYLLGASSTTRQARIKASSSSKSGGGYTPTELKKLRAAGIDPTNVKVADDFLYNGIEPGSKRIDPSKLKFNFKDASSGDPSSSPTLDKINEALAEGWDIEDIVKKLGLEASMAKGLEDAIVSSAKKKAGEDEGEADWGE